MMDEEWLDRQLRTARKLVDTGGQALRRDNLDQAEQLLDEAGAVLDMARDETTDVLEVRAQLYNERGFLLQRTERIDEALAAHERGAEICEELLDAGVEFRANSAATHINMAGILAGRGDLVRAGRENERALDLIDSLIDEEEPAMQAYNLAFGARHNLAIIRGRSGDLDGASEWMEKALDAAHAVTDENPGMWAQASQACQQVSVMMFNEKDFDLALEWGRTAEELSEKAYDVLGGDALPIYVTSQINLISYHEKAHRFAEAEDALWKALDIVGDEPRILERGLAFYEACRAQADARLEKGNLPREEVEEGYREIRERAQAEGVEM